MGRISWRAINRERGLLIDKSIAGTLTADEQKRLDELQLYADRHLARFSPSLLECALQDAILFRRGAVFRMDDSDRQAVKEYERLLYHVRRRQVLARRAARASTNRATWRCRYRSPCHPPWPIPRWVPV